MKSVKYFQPYSTKENVVTNAVLLFLSHAYRLTPGLFEDFLTSFMDDEITVGPIFGNQEVKKGGKSVIDAVIRQNSFDLNIETKLGDSFDSRQMKNHMTGIAESQSENRILMGINRTAISKKQVERYRAQAQELGIVFVATTFDEIASFFESRTVNFQVNLREITEGFREFISEQKLVPISPNRLLVNPCGTSRALNEKYGIYYDQPERSKSFCKYLGCYWDKAVRLIGEVESVFLSESKDGNFKITEALELPWLGQAIKPNREALKRVKAIIEETNYYDLENGSRRFYVVKKFHPVKFAKTSLHGIQGHRYFALDGKDGICPDFFVGQDQDVDLLAERLNKETWT